MSFCLGLKSIYIFQYQITDNIQCYNWCGSWMKKPDDTKKTWQHGL